MTMQELYDWAAKEGVTDYKVVTSDECGYTFKDVEIKNIFVSHEEKIIYLNWY